MLKNFSISDVIVGLPAGLLIFMSTLLFSTLLRQRGWSSTGLELLLLATDAFIVGGLVQLTRKKQARATALASGLIGGLVLLYISFSSPENAALNPWLFGLPGLVISTAGCLLATRG